MAFFKPEFGQTYTIRVVGTLDPESLEQVPSQFAGGEKLKLIADVKDHGNQLDWSVTPLQLQVLRDRGVAPGAPFSFRITKEGAKYKYFVSFATNPPESDEIEETDLTRKMRESTAIAQQRQTQTSTVQPQVVAMPKPAAAGPTIHTLASQALAGCLIAAIDASSSAMEYAKKKGVAFSPTSEDIQGLASTLFIQMSKMGGGLNAMAPNPDQQQLVNGGTKWAQ